MIFNRCRLFCEEKLCELDDEICEANRDLVDDGWSDEEHIEL